MLKPLAPFTSLVICFSIPGGFALGEERRPREGAEEVSPSESATIDADALSDGGTAEAPRKAVSAAKTKEASEKINSADPCAKEEARIEQRRAWLSDRTKDQSAKGPPNPQMGTPNVTAVYCQEHPEDRECNIAPPPTSFTPDELSLENQRTPEDRDPSIIGLKRELADCRERNH